MGRGEAQWGGPLPHGEGLCPMARGKRGYLHALWGAVYCLRLVRGRLGQNGTLLCSFAAFRTRDHKRQNFRVRGIFNAHLDS